MQKRISVDVDEAHDMAKAIIRVLQTFEPDRPTLAFAAVCVVVGLFMNEQRGVATDDEIWCGVHKILNEVFEGEAL